jgi:hypothetical protein
VEHKSIRIWSIFKDRSDYVKASRLLGLEAAKNVLSDEQISAALLENGITKLTAKDELLVIHDGSDIRKEYASKLDNLGKVRSLDGRIINGYNSFNTIAVDLDGKDVTLLGTEIYSNRAEEFISQKDIKLVSKPLSKQSTPEEKEHYDVILSKIENTAYINTSIITKQQIKKISDELKLSTTQKNLIHVLDRGADDNELFKFIDNILNDKFVIRLKASRLAEQSDTAIATEKLVTKEFPNKHEKHYIKIQIKSKVYQDANSIIEWGETLKGYSVVRIQLINRDGGRIFKQPMLLISNKSISNAEDAMKLYHIYLKRAKIEGVFKFLKDVLGWEESQIRDFKAIKTILTFCYFVAGYFYEIESALIENDVIKFIAYLGNGKGKVTRYYILQGFAKMITKVEVDDAIVQFSIRPDQIKQIMQLMMRGY